MENWGKYIKEEREKRGLSLRQLAAMADVPFSSIYLIERGKKDPQISTITRILAALGYELTTRKRLK